MWKYIKKYVLFAIPAALFMVGEVVMDLLQPSLMSRIVDEGVLGTSSGGVGSMDIILRVGLLMIVTVIFGGFCGSMNNVFVHFTAQNIGNEMRKDCFSHIMRMSFPQIDGFTTGSLITRVTNDITQVQNLIAQFIRSVIRTSLLTFGSIYCMFRLSVSFGWLVVCSLPFLVGTVVVCLVKATPLFVRLQARLDTINSIMQEDVAGIRMIKAFVREVYEKIRFGKANDELIRTQLGTLVIFAFMNPVMNAVMYFVVTLILITGARDVALGVSSPGIIMAAISYTTTLLNGVAMIVMVFQNISRGLVSWERVREILVCEPDIRDGIGNISTDIRGQIEFRDVSFAYPGSRQMTLKHINLTVRPGEKIAVMGATGCGKTTLVNLIPRFYDVTEGAVLVDGVDVRDYRQRDLREKISSALQKSELFSLALKENILWGHPGAGHEEVRAAAIVAQADDFISSSPAGYDTPVAERGASLSGGQKQRMSIARAILKDAEIFIFDDSTSALDLKTEARFYDALDRSRPGCTKIIVAQRIASARRADRIVVMDSGSITDAGTHEELLVRCPAYQEIYYSQMGEEEKYA